MLAPVNMLPRLCRVVHLNPIYHAAQQACRDDFVFAASVMADHPKWLTASVHLTRQPFNLKPKAEYLAAKHRQARVEVWTMRGWDSVYYVDMMRADSVLEVEKETAP